MLSVLLYSDSHVCRSEVFEECEKCCSNAGAVEPGAAVLAAALYFWQLPHFLALAWMHREDYMRGGYAMLSKFDPLGRRTAACALRNSLYMLPLGVLAAWVPFLPSFVG